MYCLLFKNLFSLEVLEQISIHSRCKVLEGLAQDTAPLLPQEQLMIKIRKFWKLTAVSLMSSLLCPAALLRLQDGYTIRSKFSNPSLKHYRI